MTYLSKSLEDIVYRPEGALGEAIARNDAQTIRDLCAGGTPIAYEHMMQAVLSGAVESLIVLVEEGGVRHFQDPQENLIDLAVSGYRHRCVFGDDPRLEHQAFSDQGEASLLAMAKVMLAAGFPLQEARMALLDIKSDIESHREWGNAKEMHVVPALQRYLDSVCRMEATEPLPTWSSLAQEGIHSPVLLRREKDRAAMDAFEKEEAVRRENVFFNPDALYAADCSHIHVPLQPLNIEHKGKVVEQELVEIVHS